MHISSTAILWFFSYLVLWNDINSNSATKAEKMCEKPLCCFMLPVGTIALAGISTWQNPLISPHKPTRCIPQGYYSNWVTLISLYIFWLPLQSRIIYSVLLCIPGSLAPAKTCASCSCPHVLHFYKLSKQQDGFFSSYCELKLVVGGFLPTSCIRDILSMRPSVEHLNC